MLAVGPGGQSGGLQEQKGWFFEGYVKVGGGWRFWWYDGLAWLNVCCV